MPCTRLATITWVCRFGSPARESQWSNPAATIPRVRTCRIPPTRVRSTDCSTNLSAWATAASCAASTARLVGSSPNAHNTDADFGTVKVRS